MLGSIWRGSAVRLPISMRLLTRPLSSSYLQVVRARDVWLEGVRDSGPPFFVFPDPDALRSLVCFVIQASNRSGRHLGLISDS